MTPGPPPLAPIQRSGPLKSSKLVFFPKEKLLTRARRQFPLRPGTARETPCPACPLLPFKTALNIQTCIGKDIYMKIYIYVCI